MKQNARLLISYPKVEYSLTDFLMDTMPIQFLIDTETRSLE